MYARGATYIYMYIVALTWLIIAKAGKMLVIYVFPIQQNIQQMYAEIQKKISCTNKEEEISVGSLRSGQKQPNINDARIQINK